MLTTVMSSMRVKPGCGASLHHALYFEPSRAVPALREWTS